MEKIKIKNKEFEIVDIRSKPNLLEIQFPSNVDLSKLDLTVITLYTAGGVKCTEFVGYTTIYKIEDNTVILGNDGSVYVELVEPEPIEPYVPSQEELAQQLENAKKIKIAESNRRLEQFLLGHPMLYTDGKYYSVTLEKQTILQGNLLAYQLELQSGIDNPVLEWNSTGEECTNWGYEDLATLAIAIKYYVKPYVAAQQSIEKQINACATIEEVNSVVIDYETAV